MDQARSGHPLLHRSDEVIRADTVGAVEPPLVLGAHQAGQVDHGSALSNRLPDRARVLEAPANDISRRPDPLGKPGRITDQQPRSQATRKQSVDEMGPDEPASSGDGER